MSAGVGIRDATESDWSALYPIFDAIVREGRTYAYPEDLPSEAARSYWMAVPPGRTVVAVANEGEDEQVLGTATMGPNRPGRGSHVATASFMVSPTGRGRGVGRALGEDMLSWARQEGYRGVQFNAVVETNTVAVRLWQSIGFEIIGTVPGAFRHVEEGYVGLHVMYCHLD